MDCYAYLVNKGSTGNVAMLFPGMGGLDNHIQTTQEMTIPSIGTPFRFDEKPGRRGTLPGRGSQAGPGI